MTTQLQTNATINSILENLSHVPHYLMKPARVVKTWQPNNLAPDLMAGLTVGLIALPQAIAFALIANLPPQMGMYATVVAAIVGALWGSTNQIQTGPSNAISILVFSSLAVVATPDTPEYILAAGMLALMAGVLQLTIGLTRLGMLVNFVSHSVIIGFASGAAILIGVGQIKPLLGLDFPSGGLLATLQNIAIHLPDTHWPTAAIGLGTIGALVLLKKINRKLPGPLMTMIVASLLVFGFNLNQNGVGVIGELPQGLPPLTLLPLFDLALIAQLSSGALAVAAIGLIQTTAIARSIATETGQSIENNQEFVGQGLANIVVGFFSGYAGSASFSRSAVSLKAGAKSPISAIFSGIFVLLAMLVLAPLTVYLPRAALAGVLVAIAYGLINGPQIMRILRGTRGDTIIMLITFLGTLFLRMEFAVLAGILASLALYLLKTSLPRVFPVAPGDDFEHFVQKEPEKPDCPQLGIIKISGDLYFGASRHVEETLLNYLVDHPRQRFLLLRMHGANTCDINGIFALENVYQACLERGGDLYLMNVQPIVYELMVTSGFYDKLGADHFLAKDEAVSHLFYHVLDPAICIYECPFRLFIECQNLPKQVYPVPKQDRQTPPVPEISPSALWQELNSVSPPTVIDVRQPREYRQGHIPQAQLKPLESVLTHPEILLNNSKVVLVCQNGQRSQRAALELQKLAGNQVEILKQGMIAWKAARLTEANGSGKKLPQSHPAPLFEG